MTESIFNSDQPAQESPAQEPSPSQEVKQAEAPPKDPYADLLKTIVTEDGRQKYATASDAINSVAHAQGHISKLEQELKALQEERGLMQQQLEKATKVEDALDRIAGQSQAVEQPSTSLDEQQLYGLVDQALSQREQQQVQSKNVNEVINNLVDKFGGPEAADKAYKAKAAELGIDVATLNDIAKKSPKAIYAYFGVNSGSSLPQKTSGSINTAYLEGQPRKPDRGRNPLLSGNQQDMSAEWSRIKSELGIKEI